MPRRRRRHAGPVVLLALWFGSWGIAYMTGAAWAWALVNLGLVHATRLFMALPHELGNVVAALLVGWTSSGVVLGQGSDQGRTFGSESFTVTIRAVDGSGYSEI